MTRFKPIINLLWDKIIAKSDMPALTLVTVTHICVRKLGSIGKGDDLSIQTMIFWVFGAAEDISLTNEYETFMIIYIVI